MTERLDYLYLDTNVLPERGELRAGFLSLAAALARLKRFQIVLPDLVVREFERRRRASAEKAVEDFKRAVSAARKHLPLLGAVYIPSADEEVEPLIEDLKRTVTVFRLDAEDARVGLEREASRIPPAARGQGARDSAIWLSVVRHHKGHTGRSVFVTKNTKDFAAPEAQLDPHPHLLSDLGDAADRFRFAFQPFVFLEELAPSVDLDDVEGFEAEIAEQDSVRLDAVELAEGLAETGAEELASGWVSGCEVVAAHSVGEQRLVKANLDVELSNGNAYRLLCWLATGPDGTALVQAERAHSTEAR